jgi:hypothetical protein
MKRSAILVAAALGASLLMPVAARADTEIIGYSGTARANLAFIKFTVPLPVLLFATPGAYSGISSEPLSTALGMPADPGFVGLFLFEDVIKGAGQSVPQYAAVCNNPQGATQAEQSWPPASPHAFAEANCPTPAQSTSSVTTAKLGDGALSISGAQSFTRTERLDTGDFLSSARTIFAEVKIGPVTIKNLEYRADVTTSGRPGSARSSHSSTVGAIEVNGQVIGGPMDLGQAGAIITEANGALKSSGLALGLGNGHSLASDDGSAVDAEATNLVVSHPLGQGLGYSPFYELNLGRARACLDISLAGANAPNDLSCL